jgi:hypothetical protein
MRVTDPLGHETEAFVSVGRATVLGGSSMSLRQFYQGYARITERRDGERRVTRERRKIENAGRRRRGSSRRRLDALTTHERESLCLGIEYVNISLTGLFE